MKRYVLTVVHNAFSDEVVVVQKNRPENQKGKFNFVGGKVEGPQETFIQAAIRETQEECGLDVSKSIRYAGKVRDLNDEYIVAVFYAEVGDEINVATTLTDEQVYVITPDILRREPKVANLMAILELCKVKHCTFDLKHNGEF